MDENKEYMKKQATMYCERKDLLHEQLKLLAEQSKRCEPQDLAAISEQMIAIYSVLEL